MLLVGCGGSDSSGGATGGSLGSVSSSDSGGTNELRITVSNSAAYVNEPCVSVTICEPSNPSTCLTVDDVLLDTGSVGLRIFKQALAMNGGATLALKPVTVSGGAQLAECVEYGDGSENWGPVQTAIVGLGREPPVSMAIQVIDSSFGQSSLCGPVCGSQQESGLCVDSNPKQAGYNGILGVGLWLQDCGASCAQAVGSSANPISYYACQGSNCNGAEVSLANQLQNPASLLQTDNNGVIVNLPSVDPGGATSVTGSLFFGIGTQSNNSVGSDVKFYAVDPNYGEFQTEFNGNVVPGFVDTGSQGLYFQSTLPTCVSAPGWYCVSPAASFAATNTGINGVSGSVSFQIGDYWTLANSGKGAFPDIGASASTLSSAFSSRLPFDWGLPFYLGRKVYIGIESASLKFNQFTGTGPVVAY